MQIAGFDRRVSGRVVRNRNHSRGRRGHGNDDAAPVILGLGTPLSLTAICFGVGLLLLPLARATRGQAMPA
jgi:hypothetical protein